MLRILVSMAVILATGWLVLAAENPDRIVVQAQELATNHRYQEALDLLAPLENAIEDTNLQYIVSAELGRSYFHLGQYREAHARFQRAVKLQPQHVETALYLQATAYLLGDRDQAFLIFEEILKSGAKDLYLAVSLPGERRFLADPEAWSLIEKYAVPIDLDLETGSVMGLTMGQSRTEVVSVLQTSSGAGDGAALTAQAGPYLVWGFAFDDADELAEVVLQVENLVKYTPYRLGFSESGWRASPAELGAIMGAPTATSTDTENLLVMSWTRSTFTVTAAFGLPRPPGPPGIADGVAMLRLIRISRPDAEQTAQPPNSDSMNP
jgi:tetratricopeptide (TPR) repeat protein